MVLPGYPTDISSPHSWQAMDLSDGFGELDQLFTEASQRKIFAELPASEEEKQSDDFSLRAEVIAERLCLLGYIEGNEKKARMLYNDDRAAFIVAVEAFQKEAGLKAVDGWVGKKTWSMLSRLVNFEAEYSPQATDSHADIENMAMLRAAQARLKVLGLTRKGPSKDFAKPGSSAVKAFHQILKSLYLQDELLGGALTNDSLRLLLNFDFLMDKLVALNPASKKRFKVRLSNHFGSDGVKARYQLRLFITRLVQIEFWLLGMEVDLSKKINYPVNGLGNKSPGRSLIDHHFVTHLRDYYINFHGLNEDEAKRHASRITPSLLRSLNAQEAVENLPADVLPKSDAIQEVMAHTSSEQKVVEHLSEGYSLGLRIWDGIKRLWRWIKKKLLRVLEYGRNLARAFYRYATKGFQIVKSAIRGATESIGHYLKGEVHYGGVTFFLEKDLDCYGYVPEGLSSSIIESAGERFKLFGLRFQLACRILGLVFSSLVKGVFHQWARLARVLVVNLREMIPIYREMREVERLIPTI